MTQEDYRLLMGAIWAQRMMFIETINWAFNDEQQLALVNRFLEAAENPIDLPGWSESDKEEVQKKMKEIVNVVVQAVVNRP